MTGFQFAVALILLAGNAYFVAAEFALVAARRSAIGDLAEQGDRRAVKVLGALDELSLMLAGSQLGITLCSLGIGAAAEPAFAALFEPVFHALGIPKSAGHVISFIVALALASYLHMVLGEMVPKSAALAGAEKMALAIGPSFIRFTRIVHPILRVLNVFANLCVRLLRATPTDDIDTTVTLESLPDVLAESRAAGLLDADEALLAGNAAELERRSVGEAMVPLAKVVSLPARPTGRQLQRAVAVSRLSRYPVRRGAGFSGFVHAKALLDLTPGQLDRPLPPALVRRMPRFDRATALAEAIAAMVADQTHLCAVTERGRTIGILSLDDAISRLIPAPVHSSD